jgi:hypothetical protein
MPIAHYWIFRYSREMQTHDTLPNLIALELEAPLDTLQELGKLTHDPAIRISETRCRQNVESRAAATALELATREASRTYGSAAVISGFIQERLTLGDSAQASDVSTSIISNRIADGRLSLLDRVSSMMFFRRPQNKRWINAANYSCASKNTLPDESPARPSTSQVHSATKETLWCRA